MKRNPCHNHRIKKTRARVNTARRAPSPPLPASASVRNEHPEIERTGPIKMTNFASPNARRANQSTPLRREHGPSIISHRPEKAHLRSKQNHRHSRCQHRTGARLARVRTAPTVFGPIHARALTTYVRTTHALF